MSVRRHHRNWYQTAPMAIQKREIGNWSIATENPLCWAEIGIEASPMNRTMCIKCKSSKKQNAQSGHT
jgi:hypothetical protein